MWPVGNLKTGVDDVGGGWCGDDVGGGWCGGDEGGVVVIERW